MLPGGKHVRRRRLRVDRDEPAAGNVVGVAAAVDRHPLCAPAADRRVDLGTALAADVDAEHVDAGLGVAVELEQRGRRRPRRRPRRRLRPGSSGDPPPTVKQRKRRAYRFRHGASRSAVGRRARACERRPARRRRGAGRDRPRAGEIRRGADPGDLTTLLHDELAAARRPALRRVLNATGVIVHTNLGRAPLAAAALERAIEATRGYSNLEYDLGEGRRGSRQDHVAAIVQRLTGAEVGDRREQQRRRAAARARRARRGTRRDRLARRADRDRRRLPHPRRAHSLRRAARRGRDDESHAGRRLRERDRRAHRIAPPRAPVELPRRRLRRAAVTRGAGHGRTRAAGCRSSTTSVRAHCSTSPTSRPHARRSPPAPTSSASAATSCSAALRQGSSRGAQTSSNASGAIHSTVHCASTS